MSEDTTGWGHLSRSRDFHHKVENLPLGGDTAPITDPSPMFLILSTRLSTVCPAVLIPAPLSATVPAWMLGELPGRCTQSMGVAGQLGVA